MTLAQILQTLTDAANISDEVRGVLEAAISELDGTGTPAPAK